MLTDKLGNVAEIVESLETWFIFIDAERLHGDSGKRWVRLTLELFVLFDDSGRYKLLRSFMFARLVEKFTLAESVLYILALGSCECVQFILKSFDTEYAPGIFKSFNDLSPITVFK